MSEFQKAAMEMVKEVSIQLILIAVGALSIAGSVLAARTTATKWKCLLYLSMIVLMLSVFSGLIALGDVVSQLSQKSFDPWETMLRLAYLGQLSCVLIGGVGFVLYLTRNIP